MENNEITSSISQNGRTLIDVKPSKAKQGSLCYLVLVNGRIPIGFTSTKKAYNHILEHLEVMQFGTEIKYHWFKTQVAQRGEFAIIGDDFIPIGRVMRLVIR